MVNGVGMTTITRTTTSDAATSGTTTHDSPLHRHRHEDEIMYVIDGDVRVDLGDDSQVVSGGIPHVFQVLSERARFLTVTSGGQGHPTFDQFVRTLGAPTDPSSLPAPVEIDPGHVAPVCADHGIEVLGPPPAPLY